MSDPLSSIRVRFTNGRVHWAFRQQVLGTASGRVYAHCGAEGEWYASAQTGPLASRASCLACAAIQAALDSGDPERLVY